VSQPVHPSIMNELMVETAGRGRWWWLRERRGVEGERTSCFFHIMNI
jgi:hypothetical protein